MHTFRELPGKIVSLIVGDHNCDLPYTSTQFVVRSNLPHKLVRDWLVTGNRITLVIYMSAHGCCALIA